MDEMHSGLRKLAVDFEKFYGFKPSKVDRRFIITLSDLSYLPKIANPRADWVITAALNAFRAFQAAEYGQVKRFATVGTGSGTDAIAALDVFPHLASVAMTDLHAEVVGYAKKNLLSATDKADDGPREIAAGAIARAGDVLKPLIGEEPYDIIYENLPNVPLQPNNSLTNGQSSATYVPDRAEDQIPAFISDALLELHYVCLFQAREFGLLSPHGVLMSSMGGRVPVATMIRMAEAAGFAATVLTMSWKSQSEPESVIGGYATEEANGRGPYSFYPTSVLERVFKHRTPAGAALRSAQVEGELSPYRLSAIKALKRHREGEEIGHTVVVIASVVAA